jgi:hypothetical protein
VVGTIQLSPAVSTTLLLKLDAERGTDSLTFWLFLPLPLSRAVIWLCRKSVSDGTNEDWCWGFMVTGMEDGRPSVMETSWCLKSLLPIWETVEVEADVGARWCIPVVWTADVRFCRTHKVLLLIKGETVKVKKWKEQSSIFGNVPVICRSVFRFNYSINIKTLNTLFLMKHAMNITPFATPMKPIISACHRVVLHKAPHTLWPLLVYCASPSEF